VIIVLSIVATALVLAGFLLGRRTAHEDYKSGHRAGYVIATGVTVQVLARVS
jgi:hypothetical protein